MKLLVTRLLVSAMASLLVACSTPQISTREFVRSDPASTALVLASQKTHGATAYRKVRKLTVQYNGKWAAVGPRFQPILADTKFRVGSVEVLNLPDRTIVQKHTGVSGKKSVRRSPSRVDVSYNGVATTNQEIKRAAALVADAYTMFLLGPFFFDRPGVVLVSAGEAVVDKSVCDQVLAILKPGFGFAKEDRVILSIDRATKQLRRVRMTLNGLESTVGAEVDITFREFRMIGGILWPTDFDERIRVPFDLHAHHWRLTDLKIE